MAVNDSSSIVKGRTPPVLLSRLTCTAFLMYEAMMLQARCVSIRVQYAACYHSGNNKKKATFQNEGPRPEYLLLLMMVFLFIVAE